MGAGARYYPIGLWIASQERRWHLLYFNIDFHLQLFRHRHVALSYATITANPCAGLYFSLIQ